MNYDYREALRKELARRSEVNTRFSQRAFAKKIGMTQGGLSEVLAGRRGLSFESAKKIAIYLNLSPEEQEIFCDSVLSKHARSRRQKQLAEARLRGREASAQYVAMTNDVFAVIRDWYHLAILELLNLTDFKSDLDWMARSLGIAKATVEAGVDRLLRLGLLQITEGNYRLTHKKLEFPGYTPSDAIKSFHKQILSKAQTALYFQSQEQRNFNTVYCAINDAELPKAKKMIGDFWRKFCADMRDTPTTNKVYCLSIQFFDIKEHEA